MHTIKLRKISKSSTRLKIFFPLFFFLNPCGFWEIFLSLELMGKVNFLYPLPWREKNKDRRGDVIPGKEQGSLKWSTLEWCTIILKFIPGKENKDVPPPFTLCVNVYTSRPLTMFRSSFLWGFRLVNYYLSFSTARCSLQDAHSARAA